MQPRLLLQSDLSLTRVGFRPTRCVTSWEEVSLKGKGNVLLILFFLHGHTVNRRIPTVSIPLRDHKGRVEPGSAIQTKWAGSEGVGGVEEKKHTKIHKPHNTITPHGFMSLFCVWGPLCDTNCRICYNIQNVKGVDLIPRVDGTDEMFWVLLHRVFHWSTYFKQACQETSRWSLHEA